MFLIWQMNNRLFFIRPINRNGFANGLNFFCLALPTYFICHLFSRIAVIHGKFYLDEFVVIKRDIEFIQYRLCQTFLPQHDYRLDIVA